MTRTGQRIGSFRPCRGDVPRLASDRMEIETSGSIPSRAVRAPRATFVVSTSSASQERVRALDALSAMRGLLIGSVFGGLIWALIGLTVTLAIAPR